MGKKAELSSAVKGWAALADEVRANSALAAPLAKVIESARKTAQSPIAKRVYKYSDIGQSRTWLDGRAKFMDGQPRQEWFGLAMSDFGTSGTILSELPLLAFAYRCTKEDILKTRIIAQIEETATWSPLQRPGWCLCVPDPAPVPADYNDGSWLATGQGVRAIANTLELMPEGSLPPELLETIRNLLRREIALINEDWELKRGWFRGGNGYPQTNQWVLPTEGLVRACLVLGKDQFPAEYELSVANLLRSMDAEGKQGEFNEGIGYAMFTVGSMVAAAHAMAAQGDPRALNHPFLQGFPMWAVHHLQPGRLRVNCFDAGGARTGRNDGGARGLLSTLAVFTGHPAARWALANLYDGPTDDLTGLLARTLLGTVEAPPIFMFYDGPARRVNWRDTWDDTGTGVWVRGGHPLDSHDHFDRGHLNFVAKGRPLLIEAGTPSYDNPSIHTLYSTVTGHNVLDIEGVKAKKAPAPISVHRLEAQGGDVTVDPTAGYPGLKSWTRNVKWTASGLDVADQVAFADGQQGKPSFHWHLGTRQDATITGEANRFTARWNEAEVTLTGNVPLLVSQEKLPDNTVTLGKKENNWDFLHTCLVVRTATPCAVLELTTHVTPLVTDPAILPTYAAYREATGKQQVGPTPGAVPLVIQAEDMVTPDSGVVISDKKVGAKVATSMWNSFGDELAKEIEVPTDGWYTVLLRYCADGSPSRSVLLDGKIPYRELAMVSSASTIGAAPSDGWSNKTNDWRIVALGERDGTPPLLLFLSQGRHRFAMRQEDGTTGMNLDWVMLLPEGADRAAAIRSAETQGQQ